MFLFYTYQTDQETALFDEVEARHCIQVLRKSLGDEIKFTDGLGRFYTGLISHVGKKGFTCTITESEEKTSQVPGRLHIAIAPTKNIDRYEWFLEKATEIGVAEITPLICENSERKKIRTDRHEKILISAMKQSLSSTLPKLNSPTRFVDFLEKLATADDGVRFIAHCRADNLPHLFNQYPAGENAVILIGPEGDFSIDEISLAEKAGFKAISLGFSRMRTETAGVAAVHILNIKSTI